MENPNHLDGTPSIHAFANRLHAGESEKMCCPWCSHQRSKKLEKCLTVTTDDLGYKAYCHHCEQTEKFVEQRGQQRQWTPLTVPYRGPVDYDRGDQDIIARWFGLRGITPQTLDTYQVGFGPARGMRFYDIEDHAITFPVLDDDGKVGNIKYRGAPEKEFRQSKNPMPGFFGRQFLKDGSGSVFITEGEIDAMSLGQCGFSPAISVPNGALQNPTKIETTKFTYLDHDIELLAPYDRVYLITDGDQPGINLRLELAQRLGRERCYTTTYPDGCKDANDVLMKHGIDAVTELVALARPIPIEGLGSYTDTIDEAWADVQGGRDHGFSTGFAELDNLWRVRPSELTTISGIPTHGKSEFVDQLMINLMKYEGQRFAVASLESTEGRHTNKLISKLTGESVYQTDRHPCIDRAEWEGYHAYLAENIFPLRFTDVTPTVDIIIDLAKIAQIRHGINGLIIDPYTNLVQPAGRDDRQLVGDNLGKLERFSKQSGLYIWVVAHPTKMWKDDNGDFAVPEGYNISGSANWMDKSDNILVVYRPATDPGTRIYVRKNKLMGYRGHMSLSFDLESGTYSDTPY